ncbi:hypothetical protein LUZ60_004890 [Juncus effusus]|nr:hypothetical protein LUZ60_004890 [Juncus effusus]
MEEESFELRVKRLFGSHLFDKVPSSSFPASSWSVAAGEVVGEKWNRPSAVEEGGEDDAAADRADTPCSSAFYGPDGCFSKKNRRENPRGEKDRLEADLDEIDEDDNDDDDKEGEGVGDEEIDVRASIGLDPTLDREEEEDENDRAAFGVDQAADRVYMSEVMDHGPHISIHSVVPEIFDEFAPDLSRDPRADRSAAMKRLKEDNNTKLSKTRVTEKDTSINNNNNNNTPDIKPILKRKESQDGTKPKKRVRFGTELKQEEEDSNAVPVPVLQSDVPDYLKNPSKYTKYTFDDSTDNSNDEEMNKAAFNDFRNLVNNSTESDEPFELPASVPFNPRKKLIPESDSDAMMMHVDVGPTDTSKLCFADEASESCEMDEDLKEERESGGERKPAPSRRYRSKEREIGDE